MALPPLARQPSVSVLISSYNYAAFLGAAVQSALAQTYTPDEVLVVDDGSTDGSREVARRLERENPHVRLITQANAGQAAALNAGFAASRGDVICLLDADDVFEPTKVARTVTLFHEAPRAGLAVHRVRAVDHDERPLPIDPTPWPLSHGWCAEASLGLAPMALRLPPTSALSVRRELAARLFPIDRALTSSADGLIHRVAPLLTEIVATREPLVRYRYHGRNLIGAQFETPQTVARRLHDAEQIHAASVRAVERVLGPAAARALGPVERDAVWLWTRAWQVLIGDASAAERRAAATALLARPDRVPWAPIFQATRVWPGLGALLLRTVVTDNAVKRLVRRIKPRLRP